jgi:methylenetetrahydrofolate dehydrogenase (NADP+)/methenyltetrahydrofolate cyclohydrolase
MVGMQTRIIDGRKLAARMQGELAGRIGTMVDPPCLAVVIVGDDPASRVYVAAKGRAAASVGILSRIVPLASSVTEADVLATVRQLNEDSCVDAILVQLPLPSHVRATAVIEAVDPSKDVDGFHPLNMGRLGTGIGMVPCTPAGIMLLLSEARASIRGSRVLVIGCGAIAGRPAAALLSAAGATVTMAHKDTRDLAWECRRAEIVVAAAGCAGLVGRGHLQEGAIVVDVGINRLADGRLVGDVAYEECLGWASAITPVPGGVGPMTIACLMQNTLAAADARRQPPAVLA